VTRERAAAAGSLTFQVRTEGFGGELILIDRPLTENLGERGSNRKSTA
jgi:hypothetical protein